MNLIEEDWQSKEARGIANLITIAITVLIALITSIIFFIIYQCYF